MPSKAELANAVCNAVIDDDPDTRLPYESVGPKVSAALAAWSAAPDEVDEMREAREIIERLMSRIQKSNVSPRRTSPRTTLAGEERWKMSRQKGQAMTRISQGRSAHTWVANRAFTRLTGIKKVCLTCGQTNLNAQKTCPRPLGGNKAAK
jgi:hypothetical protein